MATTKILVLYYSMHDHVATLADAVAEGARAAGDVEVDLRRVPELMSDEELERADAKPDRSTPRAKVEDLPGYDALCFGTPTRFGNMCAQMRNFLDQTGPLWQEGSLVGKPASVFTSTATQHGGQETTITSFHTTLLHLGMLVVGVPYTCRELSEMGELSGGSPYGAGTLAGPDGKRTPTDNELRIARFQGRHVARIAQKLGASRTD